MSMFLGDSLTFILQDKLQEISVFIEDALQFLGAFGTPISQSAAHIYLSALPSAPTGSIISKTFLPQFKNILTFETGKGQYWPALQNVFRVSDGSTDVIGFPDGKRFVVSSFHSTTISVWDAETCIILKELEHSSDAYVQSVAVSQDCKYVVSANWDGICVWNLESMTVEVRVELVPGRDRDRDKERWDVTISLDGTRIALVRQRTNDLGSWRSEISVWDARTGGAVVAPIIKAYNGMISSIAFSSNNSKVYAATWSQDEHVHAIQIWDVETGRSELLKLEGQEKPSHVLAFSPDGDRLAFCSVGNQIDICDIKEHTQLGPFGDHGFLSIRCLAFSKDGQRILSGTHMGVIYVWNAWTGCLMAGPFEGTPRHGSLAFFGENRIISSLQDGTVRIWNTASGVYSEPFEGHTFSISSVEFSPNGDQIVSCAYYKDRTIRMWDTKTGGAYWTHLSKDGFISFAAFSPDGYHIVTVPSDNDGTMQIWNIADTSTHPVTIQASGTKPIDLKPKISPDGKFVTAFIRSESESGSGSHTLGIWDTTTGSPVPALLKYTFSTHSEMESIAFWDGEVLVTRDRNTVYIYNTKNDIVTWTPFRIEGDQEIWTPTPSPDHRLLAAYVEIYEHRSQNIRIWDVETGNGIRPFTVDTKIVCLAFSPNNRCLVSGSQDGTLLIWDVKSNFAARPLALKGHTGRVESVAFSQDSRYIVSGGDDSMIRVWDISDLGDENGEKIIAGGLPEFRDDDELADGWVRGREGELLFWVPWWNREGLYRPRNTVVIGKGANKLNFTRFVHGEDWYKCYTGPSG